jgi:DNA-binding Lrp family transcriptional regulator
MVTAFVLINVSEREFKGTAEQLLSLPGVAEVHVVAGEYDMLAVVRVGDNAELSDLLTERVIHTPGVQRTKTLISLQAFT